MIGGAGSGERAKGRTDPALQRTGASAPDVAEILRQVRRIELRTERLVSSLASGG
jgi:hypothetical protein